MLQLNGQALEIANVEGLRASAVFFWMGCLLGGPRADDLPPSEKKVHLQELEAAWASWRTVVDRLSLDIRVENEARASLERKYFAGRDIFFADVGQTWAEHVNQVERLSALAETMASTGGPKARPHRSSANRPSVSMTERVAGRVTRLADDARVRAYEIIWVTANGR